VTSDAHAIPFKEIRAWMFEAALPLWARAGVDRERGGFHEKLDFSAAEIVSSYRRTRVACRQVYVFSHAAELGWTPGLEISRAGALHLASLYLGADKGWPRRIDGAGQPLDATPDLYDLAFVMFAFAWRHRVAGDAESRGWIHKTLDFIEAHMRAGNGGFLHALPPEGPRQQNPHMHLLEASLVAFEATGETRFAELARALVQFFRARFFDGRTLCEFFRADWSRAEGEAGRAIEPGHHFEWVWILAQYARLTGDATRAEQDALFAFAEGHGVGSDGATVQVVRDDGAVIDASSRTWPNTERIKAHLALFEFAGRDPRAAVLQSCRLLLERYLATDVRGLWTDHFDANARPIASDVPASTFYHVFLAFAEVLRLEPRLRALDAPA